ncbi:MAG: M23 family metallopeptidase [Gammaproteobacteria bacterium]|nr:M23 family metallopeptidase [Gammaproteobacteria bacterium]
MGIKVKGLVICALMLLGAKAYGDTRVLIYNSTLRTLEVELRQTETELGSSYWSAGEASISPSRAKEVLSIQKNDGVEDDRVYGFELDVTDGTSTIVFKIRIEGRQVGRETFQAVGDGTFFSDSTLRSAPWGDRNVRFRQEGNGDFMFVIADPSVPLFRFPVEDRSLIGEGNSSFNPLAGPLSPDMRAGLANRGVTYQWEYSCMAFNGKKNPPHCYSDHRGTDFMLKGGFRQMDRPGNYIVAARAGTVVKVVDDLYDRCKGGLKGENGELKPGVSCDGNNGEGLDGNHIIIDHGKGLFTEYYHLKTDSSLVEKGASVNCGQRLARIGSSGISTKPHLHFEVLMCKDEEDCESYSEETPDVNPYKGTASVNPYNGTYTGRGFWVDQGNGRLPADTCAAGQPIAAGPSGPAARGCSDDADCGEGNYCNKRLGENRCLVEGSFSLGEACYKNRECSTGKCQGRGDNRMCVCNVDSNCEDGEYCNKRAGQNRCLVNASIPLGQSCDTNQQCVTGKCQGSGNNRMCVCNTNSDCANGQYCNKRAGQNRCLVNASKSLGQSCSTNQECSSGKCQGSGNNRMCVCNVNSDCANGQYCNKRAGQNRCLVDAGKSMGQSCSTNQECSTGKCQGTGNNRACVCANDSDCSGSQQCKKRPARKNICR